MRKNAVTVSQRVVEIVRDAAGKADEALLRGDIGLKTRRVWVKQA